MNKPKLLLAKNNPKKWTAVMLRLSKWEAKISMGMITGENEVDYHRFRMVRPNNSYYRFCGVEKETTTNILYD